MTDTKLPQGWTINRDSHDTPWPFKEYEVTLYTAEQVREMLAATPSAEPAPIDMVLHCPKCGGQHIDAPEDDCHAASDGTESRWTNPPHRSHLCHGCGHIWRPSDVPTNGVAAVKTKGKADSPVAASGAEPQISESHGPEFKPSMHDEGETYCARCLTRSPFLAQTKCKPHIVQEQTTPGAESLTDEQIDEMLRSIDRIALDHEAYEYGLPIHAEAAHEAMREAVRAALATQQPQAAVPRWWIARNPECRTPAIGNIASVCDRKAMHYEVPLYEQPPLPVVPEGWKLLKDSTQDERSYPPQGDHHYSNECMSCLRTFYGAKLQRVCRVCSTQGDAV